MQQACSTLKIGKIRKKNKHNTIPHKNKFRKKPLNFFFNTKILIQSSRHNFQPYGYFPPNSKSTFSIPPRE